MKARQKQIKKDAKTRKEDEDKETRGPMIEGNAINADDNVDANGDLMLDKNKSFKAAKFLELENKVTSKNEICFEEDFLSMTIFSYLKSNQKVWDEDNNRLGWGIKPEKQA